MIDTRQHPQTTSRHNAFTLIELLVVVAIIVILAAVSIPAIKSLTKGNAQAQAVNQIRAMLGYARSIAISQHRRAGVVFFDETPAFSNPVNSRQTAMQLFVEDYNQAQYGTSASAGPNASPPITIYVSYTSDRQYLPPGAMVASFNVDATTGTDNVYTGDNTATGVGAIARAVLFDPNGQAIVQNQLATPLTSGTYNSAQAGQYPTAYGDWMFTSRTAARVTSPCYIPGNAYASMIFFVFNKTDYNTQNFPQGTVGQPLRTAWIEQHADAIVVNPYTGNPIR